MRRPAFMTALLYVPLRAVENLPSLLKTLKVSYLEKEEDNYEDDFGEAGAAEAQGLTEFGEVACYDLSKNGYIGVPRAFGLRHYGHLDFVDRTVRFAKRPELFPSRIAPRDEAQKNFWNELKWLIEKPGPQDIVANAMPGTGKTIMTLWLEQEVIQAPMLVTVPNNLLRAQWVERITETMGREWARKYVGHIQQDIMDYEGRLITIGLAPSLAIRNYPLPLRRAFEVIVFDEWHKIGAPRMSQVLGKYPARVRLGLTATNRRDALLKVATLHLGKPKVVSKQAALVPEVYIARYKRVLHKNTMIASEFHMITQLTRMKDRNEMLANIIHDFGWSRNRMVVALSDRTDQLLKIRELLIARGIPEINIGILCGTYKGTRFSEYAGKVVEAKITMTQDEKDDVAGTCNIILTTWGQFDTGADIARLDMGVELSPRSNLRQGIGRVNRLDKDKLTPEWYGVDDEILYYPPEDNGRMFADPLPKPWMPLYDTAKGRRASYDFHNATVQDLH